MKSASLLVLLCSISQLMYPGKELDARVTFHKQPYSENSFKCYEYYNKIVLSITQLVSRSSIGKRTGSIQYWPTFETIKIKKISSKNHHSNKYQLSLSTTLDNNKTLSKNLSFSMKNKSIKHSYDIKSQKIQKHGDEKIEIQLIFCKKKPEPLNPFMAKMF